ncbi:hypothetical protein TSUD_264990 [Trifolium subterraneum]|uniref:Uncharacterized protein n=1 Tax=Trifolium subterraneum TaxID=3900 RepID=A0A2Z6M842_TRISU|nr:hypothetical protein TSUD_264990 [Trifolium subterraneum]
MLSTVALDYKLLLVRIWREYSNKLCRLGDFFLWLGCGGRKLADFSSSLLPKFHSYFVTILEHPYGDIIIHKEPAHLHHN